MNLKEIIFGDKREIVAQQTIKKLSKLAKLNTHQEQQIDEAKRITRRHFLRQAAIYVSGAAILLATGECMYSSSNTEDSKDSKLNNFISPGMIDHFNLQDLALRTAKVYQFATTDGIPTSLHVYDSSLKINSSGIIAMYELFNSKNTPKIVEALKESRIVGKDYTVNPNDPEEVYFQYKYSYSGKYPQIPVGIFPFAGATKQRVMLIVNDKDAPQWSKIGDGITRQYITPGSSIEKSLTCLTIINIDKLKARGEKDIFITAGITTEICQQSIKAITIINGQIASSDSTEDIVAQEGVCNTLGTASLLKIIGYNWNDANEWLASSYVGNIPGAPEPLKNFQLTESVYNLLPNNGLLAK
ncbi:MAG: hypothetical protein Q7R97_01985 [Candidatus Daviesbacteria bacterium]|nr:hypothetical protein [Candidatus Daviesbacteria bacterium]